MNLTRPLVCLDLETTGIDIVQDRIVQIGLVRVEPSWTIGETKTRLVNPGRPIPPEATKVHGLRDEDVRDAPTFQRIARGLLDVIGDADLAGYNIRQFDLPMLLEELARVGLRLDLSGRRIFDAYEIWRHHEPRTLTDAARRFANIDHESGAHDAGEDVRVTVQVLRGMADAFVLPDIDAAADEIEQARDAVDLTGRFRWDDQGEVVFAFGKHQGQRLGDHLDYAKWMLGQSFPQDVRRLCEDALDGHIPRRPRS